MNSRIRNLFSSLGIEMYVASLSIIILTLFGFWFSALGFGVYGLYVFNHNQVSGATVEPLNNKFERDWSSE